MFASIESARKGLCVKQMSICYGPLSSADPLKVRLVALATGPDLPAQHLLRRGIIASVPLHTEKKIMENKNWAVKDSNLCVRTQHQF